MAASDFETVLESALSGAICSRVHVSLPARVVTYYQATQTADVQPVVRARYRSEDDTVEHYKLPVIPGVPVVFPQGGGCSITWPLAAGNSVLLVVAERSLDEWKATGDGDVSARSARRFDLTDAVALAGLSSPSTPLAQVLAGTLVVGAPAIALGSAGALQPFVFGTAMTALFNAHVHPTPVGPSGPPQEGAVVAPMNNPVSATFPHLSTKIKGE